MLHKTNINDSVNTIISIPSSSAFLISTLGIPPEDKNNITFICRNLEDCKNSLGMNTSLKEFIIEHSKKLGKKINILDSGCGIGTAIDEILSDPELDSYVNVVSGISLNYFSNIQSLMKKHGDRFHYYYGKVQFALSDKQVNEKFDIILDVLGPYMYSVDKINVLKLYHELLNPQGIAKIAVWEDSIREDKVDLLSQFSKQYPETLQYEMTTSKLSSALLTITKSKERWPASEYSVVDYKEGCSLHKRKLPLEEAREGNAVLSCARYQKK